VLLCEQHALSVVDIAMCGRLLCLGVVEAILGSARRLAEHQHMQHTEGQHLHAVQQDTGDCTRCVTLRL
jgi:hypothetical protein